MFCLPSRPSRKTEDERERIKQEMAEAVAAYRGPIVKCPPGRAMGSSGQNEADLEAADATALQSERRFKNWMTCPPTIRIRPMPAQFLEHVNRQNPSVPGGADKDRIALGGKINGM
jgi:hypothetical protein